MKTKMLLLLLLLIPGCTQPDKPLSETEKQSIATEAKAVVKEMFEALAVNNVDKFVDLLDSGQDMTFVFADKLMNFSAMMDFIKQMSPAIEKQTFETITEKYIIIDASAFLYTWNGKNGMIMKNGLSEMYNNFFATYLFRKIDGKWKFLYGHESPGMAVADSTRMIK